MAFSYFSLIYPDLDPQIKLRGIELFWQNQVEITRPYNNGCRAIVKQDNQIYSVFIGFHRIGSPKQICTCVTYSYDYICDHIIATALKYDQGSGIDIKALLVSAPL
ncbi:MAG: hypothetical protein WCL07_04820 [bacterium]